MIRLRTFSILLFLFTGCFTSRDLSTANLSSLYRPDDKAFHVDLNVYNETDTTLRLFIRLSPSEFLFARWPDDKFRAAVYVRAELLKSYEEGIILDSSSAKFYFNLNEKDDTKIVDMIVPANDTMNYLLRCTVIDSTKGVKDIFLLPVDRSSNPSRQDFLLTSYGVPLFRYYLAQMDTISVQFHDESTQKFLCKYYNRNFPLAPPPFSFDVHEDFNYRPDSSFELTKEQMQNLCLPATGFYHIQTDSFGRDGLTLFRFSQGFPDVTSPKQMIEAIRYLTSKKEFEEIKNSESPKSMVDNFWLTHGGNEEKTRILIKKYYGRVREANKYFSSHNEGWRTDRGMIYVIFGSPGIVYKGDESESWTYGTPTNSLALNFFFIKVKNPFTDNDFILSRSPTYEGSWDRAVEVWRQGRAYNSFN
jgi:GWxTD domain-containing protein